MTKSSIFNRIILVQLGKTLVSPVEKTIESTAEPTETTVGPKTLSDKPRRNIQRRNVIETLELCPQLNQFCIVAVPTASGSSKNFIGQVCSSEKGGFMISFLKKSFDKFFFPNEDDFSYVRQHEIVYILNHPIVNKRDQFLFLELKQLEIKVH